jgi:hypothetical protein
MYINIMFYILREYIGSRKHCVLYMIITREKEISQKKKKEKKKGVLIERIYYYN